MKRTLKNNIIKTCIMLYMLMHGYVLYAQGSINMEAGDFTTLTYYGVSRIQSVGWRTSKPSVVGFNTIAEYSVSAIIEAYNEGSATITATYYYWDTDYLHLLHGEVKWYVTVKLPEPSSINLRVDSVTINKKKYLHATLYPEKAKRDLTWESSDDSIVKVDENGVISGINLGSADITVTTHNGLSAKGTITVHPVYVKSIEIQELEPVLCGRPQPLDAVIAPEDATFKDLVWSTSNDKIATIEDGILYPKQCGEVKLTAIAIDDHHVSASRTIQINPVLVEKIELSQQEAEIIKYDTLYLCPILYPADVTYKDVVWTSSDEDVAIVRDGKVIAKKPGKTIITVITTDGTELSSSCNVTVLAYDYQATLISGAAIHSDININEITLPLVLECNFPATHLQFDVRLPKGLRFVSAEKGYILSESHNVTVSDMGTNTYRVLCSSDNNARFISRSGNVAVLTLNVTRDMDSNNDEIGLERIFVSDIDVPSTLFKIPDHSMEINAVFDENGVCGFAIFNSETGTLTFKFGVKPEGNNVWETDNTTFDEDNRAPWIKKGLNRVVFDSSYADARPTSTAFWFAFNSIYSTNPNDIYLTEIEGIENLNTSNVTNMSKMFKFCQILENLDVSHFDTHNVTDMSGMFFQCNALKSLDVSNFDTSNVTEISRMFGFCKTLTSLDLSNFNTSKVTKMDYMFYQCIGLTDLNLINIDTSGVTDMNNMFCGCSSLTSLDVSKFDTKNVTNMYSMFDGCSSLTSLETSHFNTSSVTDMTRMFRDCSSLKSLDVSKFDTKNVTNMYGMFYGCSNLESLDVSKFDTKNVTQMGYGIGSSSGNGMFQNCSSLTSLDVSHFDTSNVTDFCFMFAGCSKLKSLDLSNFNTCRAKSMDYMFAGCSALTSIDVSNFDTSSLFSKVVYPSGGNAYSNISMFEGCTSLTSLDLSSFNTASLTGMGKFFSGCTNLTTIYVGDGWSIEKVKYSADMFKDCTKLIGGAGTVFDNSVTDATYARVDGGTSAPGYFTYTAYTREDINRDGNLDAKDITDLIAFIAGKSPNSVTSASADVNSDGVVNIADIVMVSNMVARK